MEQSDVSDKRELIPSNMREIVAREFPHVYKTELTSYPIISFTASSKSEQSASFAQ